VIAEVEINNCPPAVRYLLTKGVTHQEVSDTPTHPHAPTHPHTHTTQHHTHAPRHNVVCAARRFNSRRGPR
jgi:hypothetical protein